MAKKKLHDLEAEVPAADPAAVARMKYEEENRTKPSTFHNFTGFLRPGPDTSLAAKSGPPAMNPPKQLIPANVPPPSGATTTAGFNGDVTVAPVAGAATPASTANITLATDPASLPKQDAAAAKQDAAANAKDTGKKKNEKKNKKNQKQDQAAAPASPVATPAATAAQPDQAPAATPDQSQTPSAKP